MESKVNPWTYTWFMERSAKFDCGWRAPYQHCFNLHRVVRTGSGRDSFYGIELGAPILPILTREKTPEKPKTGASASL